MTDLMNTTSTSTTSTDGLRDGNGDSPDRGAAVPEQLEALRAELAALKAEVVRLDADLDESRRLNLRAAELLDIVYEELGAPGTTGGGA